MITIAIDTIRMASDIEQQHRKFPPIPVPQDKSQKKIEPIVDTLTLEQKDFKLSEDKFAQGVIAKLDLNQMEENLLTVNKLVYSTEFDCMVDYISFYKAIAAQKI